MSANSDSDNSDKTVGKRAYNQFLRTIGHQTGSPMHPMIDITGLRLNYMSYSGYSGETFTQALRLTKRDGCVVEWKDNAEWTTGTRPRTRVALTLEGVEQVISSYPYTEDDIETIKRIRKVEAARDDVSKEIIAWANQHLATLENE